MGYFPHAGAAEHGAQAEYCIFSTPLPTVDECRGGLFPSLCELNHWSSAVTSHNGRHYITLQQGSRGCWGTLVVKISQFSIHGHHFTRLNSCSLRRLYGVHKASSCSSLCVHLPLQLYFAELFYLGLTIGDCGYNVRCFDGKVGCAGRPCDTRHRQQRIVSTRTSCSAALSRGPNLGFGNA